eukprot:scpid95799/ scgid27257/ 
MSVNRQPSDEAAHCIMQEHKEPTAPSPQVRVLLAAELNRAPVRTWVRQAHLYIPTMRDNDSSLLLDVIAQRLCESWSPLYTPTNYCSRLLLLSMNSYIRMIAGNTGAWYTHVTSQDCVVAVGTKFPDNHILSQVTEIRAHSFIFHQRCIQTFTGPTQTMPSTQYMRILVIANTPSRPKNIFRLSDY